MKFTFEVGSVEKHRIDFSWNSFWGILRISVDGRRFASDVTLFSPVALAGELDVPAAEKWKFGILDIGLIRRWTIPVGKEERHVVVIEKTRARWLAGFRASHYRVLVDGVGVREYQGY
jgi:hypothetical protein